MSRMAYLLACACLLGGASLARAEDGAMTVKVADLNLKTAAGASAALGRIGAAAKRFCGETDIRDLTGRAEAQKCRRTMMDRAVTQVAMPMVTDLYANRSALLLAER